MSNQVPGVGVEAVPGDARPLDVREADEWAAGHAPSAQHIPMSELSNRLGELTGDQDPLYVICRSGGRSARVVEFLAQQGYPAVNVDGGMQAWARVGRPLERDGSGPAEII
ncbi:MAG: rhodanese-like domain-containing protein [Actinomycetota bacterium]|nr:rhodanese-like domain-containing protein [Actinomycetota bacterium]